MSRQVRLAYIGAGNVNFGGGEGPWDHAARFERMPGVTCVGAADLDVRRAEAALAARRSGPRAAAWQDARAFADWRRMIERTAPEAVVIGLPPAAHGRIAPPANVEVVLAERGIAMLVEKPLSLAAPEEVLQVAAALRRGRAVVSAGYMFRYSAAVAKMREILDQTPGGPRVLLARYDCAYSEIRKADWWDVRRAGGPIVEQATHLLDLARYLCGEVDLDTVQARRITASGPGGRLVDLPTDAAGQTLEAHVPPSDRIPRATLAQWRFATGALGSIAHGVLLHQKRYEAELEAWADGVRCILSDPYGRCRLGVRRSGSEETVWTQFDDDAYMAQDAAFIEAIRTGSPGAVRSTYADAAATYRLTQLITTASRDTCPPGT